MINKILYILLFIISVKTCFCQYNKDEYDPEEFQANDQILKTNPLAIIWGPIPFTAEYRLVIESFTAPNQSIQLGASYLGKSIILTLLEDNNTNMFDLDLIVKGFRFQCAYKYYFYQKNETFGFYVSPFFSYSMAKFTNRYYNTYDEHVKATYINYNIIAGYQAGIMNIFILDIFAGFGYRDNYWIENFNQTVSSIDDSDLYFYDMHLKLILGFNAGISF